MTPRIIAPLAAALVAASAAFLAAPPMNAQAQIAPPTCQRGVQTQYDMNGTYIEDAGWFRLIIFPCGGASLEWMTPDLIEHMAVYGVVNPVPGGGYTSRLLPEMHGLIGPWGTSTMTYKPAERGAIQVLWWVPQTQEFQIRHAWKQ